MEKSYVIVVYRSESDFRKYNAIAHTIANGYLEIHTSEGQVILLKEENITTIILDKRFKELLKEAQDEAQAQAAK